MGNGQTRQKRRGNRVILYIRVSSITGREESLISDEVQLNVGRQYAAREGLSIVSVIKDIDLSGRSIIKRSIRKAIGAVERNEADGVIVWKISRWGRNQMDSMTNIIDLQNVDGFILSATENLEDIETSMGRFSLTQMLAIAQLQSDQVGETWVNIHDFRRDQGLPHAGGARFGYTYESSGGRGQAKGKYAVDPATAPWLAKAYFAYVSGVSMQRIIRDLNAAGMRTTKDSRWSYAGLKACLDSGFGAGKIIQREYKKNKRRKTYGIADCAWLDGAHDPVIDEATWSAYLRRRGATTPARIKSAPYLSAGLVYCKACGGHLSATWRYTKATPTRQASKHRVLACNKSRTDSTTKTCGHPASIKESRVNELILDWLLEHAADDKAAQVELDRVAQVKVARSSVDRLDAEIARLTRRLVTATEKMLDGKLSEDTFHALEVSTQASLVELRRERADLATDIVINELPATSAFQAIADGWTLLDPSVINEGLRRIVGRVEVDGTTRIKSERVRILGRWESGR